MEIAIIILLILIFISLVLLIVRRQSLGSNDQAVAYLKEEKIKLQEEVSNLRIALSTSREQTIQSEAGLIAEKDKILSQEKNIADLHLRLKLEFENIANKVLDDKTAKFTENNRTHLDTILKPFKENIKAFEEKVDKVYKDESAERNKLEGVLKEMMEQSKQIQTDANNLTKALKGDNKKQGNWGEVILERVLERSGLIKDREYRLQANLSSETGSRYQPDVIIDLPEEKNLIIDAKVSLVQYEQLVNSENEEEKLVHLKLHIQSVKAHIDGLSSKNYQHLYRIKSPDFVLLFIPIESSFSVTIQADHDIFNYAWDRKVVMVSPTTLLATLRTIASIWKVDRQNKNVFEIAHEAGSLYDKFVGFLDDMEKIGKNLGMAQKSHEEAFKKLNSGSGNLISKVEKIKKLGAKTKGNKQIDVKFLEEDLD